MEASSTSPKAETQVLIPISRKTAVDGAAARRSNVGADTLRSWRTPSRQSGIATANAPPEIKRIALLITRSPGGRGAVREAAEAILRAQDHRTEILKKYDAE